MEKELQTAVTVNLEEYKSFIIYQYEAGKLNESLTVKNKELEKECAKLIFNIENVKEMLKGITTNLLNLLYNPYYVQNRDKLEDILYLYDKDYAFFENQEQLKKISFNGELVFQEEVLKEYITNKFNEYQKTKMQEE